MNFKITISQLFAEDIFDIFYRLVIRDGGDGSGAIVCANPKECSEAFANHLNLEHKSEFWKPAHGIYEFRDRYKLKEKIENGYQYYYWINKQESFIFTNDAQFELQFGEITWIVENDCWPGFVDIDSPEDYAWIKGIEK